MAEDVVQFSMIDRLNAFMDRGWMVVLTPLEKDVWHIYNRHASKEGVAWPSPKTIAIYVGHDAIAHVRAARLRLVEAGLLQPMKASRYPSGALKSPYRVVVVDPPEGEAIQKFRDAMNAKRSEMECLDTDETDDQPSRSGTPAPRNRSKMEQLEDGNRSESERSEDANRSETEHLEPPTVPISARNRSESDRATVPDRNTEQTNEQSMEEKRHTLAEERAEKARRATVKERRPGDAAVVAIYQAYPRRIGRGAALKSIVVALRNLERKSPTADGGEAWESWLLERVKQYADARGRSIAANPRDGPQYTPHPLTWFSQQRFDDDPAEWEPRSNSARGASYGQSATRTEIRAASREYEQDDDNVPILNAGSRKADPGLFGATSGRTAG